MYSKICITSNEIDECLRSKNGKKIPTELRQLLKNAQNALELFIDTTDELIEKANIKKQKAKMKRSKKK